MNVTADAITSALVHSLWQDALVGLVLSTALVALRHVSANTRYLICCAALGLMAALPVATAIVVSERGSFASPAAVVDVVHVAGPVADATRIDAPLPAGDVRSANWLASARPWMLPVWFTGVLVCSLRLVMAGAHTVALRRRSDEEHGPIAVTVARLASRIGIGRAVSVRISMMTHSPATLGFLRPVILLPPAVALGVTPQQLEALLAHELAHIRRHDYLINILQMVAETLFFYHPAVWWVSKRIRVERELCCDDIAVDACGDAVCYAEALTKVARMQMTQPGMALGAASGPFVQRVQRLLGVAATSRPVYPLWVTVATMVLIVAVLFTGSYAQSSSPGTLAPADADRDSSLSGRVVDARSGRSIAGASVRAQYISGVQNPPKCAIGDCENIGDPILGRIPIYRVTADDNGRFTIPNAKPGDYLVAATAPGYVQRYFGETADNTPEMSVHVSPGERTPPISIPLELAGSVSGRILADNGEGLPGVEVELLRRSYFPGGTQPVAFAFAQTEGRGTYTFRNVTQGEYFVRAYASRSIVPTRNDAPSSYVPTHFPEATDVAFAQPVVLASGQELSGVDFALQAARTREVSGRLVDPAGASLATAMVHLIPHFAGTLEDGKIPVAPDGRFRVANVPAGDYLITISDTNNERSWNTVARDVAVRDDVKDLQLVAGPSVTVSGRVMREDGRSLPFDPTELRLSTDQRSSSLGTHSAGSADVAADGTFSMRSGAGTLALRIVGIPPRWFVTSIQLNGVDVTDVEFDLAPGVRHRLDIALTDRVSRVAGTVTDRSARPVSNALVVLFPEDRARWRGWGNTGSIRTTFSHQQGRYEIDSLPTSKYRVVAVTSLPRNAWTDPDVLARLWPSASPLALDDLGQATLHLRVVPAPTDLLR